MKKKQLEDQLIEVLRNKGFVPSAAVRYAESIVKALPSTNGGEDTEDKALLRSELYDLADALQRVGLAI